ncbi:MULTISPECIES: NfeD family protein [Chitinibacter]|uniref:NfeD family protein n=1 Tax=Chitinibacter TaxID=230666 RepID=UPI00064640D6|nr:MULTISPECIES: NfeD family protein [Chitinibacter]
MSAFTLWIVATIALAIGELFTTTFYLLAIAAGTAVGALLAHFGLALEWQLFAAAGSALLSVWLLQRWKSRQPVIPASEQDDDVGQTVTIAEWQGEQRARVQYRGTQWDAELAPGQSRHDDALWIIVAKQGSRLIISQV